MGTVRKPAFLFGGRNSETPRRTDDQLAVDPDLAAEEVDPVDGHPKHSPWRSPVPAAKTIRVR